MAVYLTTKKIIKDYFLFPHIGRMDDIWASYYVESLGYKVVYNYPTVYQDRNEHAVSYTHLRAHETS